jgi:hypothetical protein
MRPYTDTKAELEGDAQREDRKEVDDVTELPGTEAQELETHYSKAEAPSWESQRRYELDGGYHGHEAGGPMSPGAEAGGGIPGVKG